MSPDTKVKLAELSEMSIGQLAAYENTPIAAFDLCSVATVSDFKEISRYRLLGTGGFEQVTVAGGRGCSSSCKKSCQIFATLTKGVTALADSNSVGTRQTNNNP